MIKGFQFRLRKVGPYYINTSEAESGRDAISILEHYTVDLVVLDLMMELSMRQPGRVFTKEEIYKNVWKLDQFDPNSVNVYINFFCAKK